MCSRAVGLASPEEEAANIAAAVEAIAAEPQHWDQALWHGNGFDPADAPTVGSCGTSHCLAGWMQALLPIGDETVTVAYMVQEGIYSSVLIECNGFSSCSSVLDTVTAAWGKPFSVKEYGTLPDRYWSDGPVVGGWSYNQFSAKGTALMSHTEWFSAIKAKQAAKARSAADDL